MIGALGLQQVDSELARLAPRPARGRVLVAVGTVLRAVVPSIRLGELCRIERACGAAPLWAEAIGMDGDQAVLAPLGEIDGLAMGAEVIPTGNVLRVPTGEGMLGRVVDGLGRPLDEATKGPCRSTAWRPVMGPPPPALDRALVERPLALGIRALDGLVTCAEGQRLGIYGEPGGGKSTLLASMIRGADVDVVVVGLVGERGREVRDFLERQLDEVTRARTVLVVATSDRPAVERVKASYTATTIAESFRNEGKRVLLVIDSITRFARALREIGLAAGEPPSRRGFPPSTLAELPRLMERAGLGPSGSITAFYTVLVEGDGSNDPIAEETRSILDGHIVLSPALAASGHYPAIDILSSRSRVMEQVVDLGHRQASQRIRSLMHRYQELEFLLQVGEYKTGNDAHSDAAIAHIDEIRRFLRQDAREPHEWPETLAWLRRIGT